MTGGLAVESGLKQDDGLRAMEDLMIRWRIAAQRWTPGGSEYMDPAFCEKFIREQREDHARTKLENARLRKELAEATRAPSDAALVEALEGILEDAGDAFIFGRMIRGDMTEAEHLERSNAHAARLAKARAALAAAKGQQP